VEAACPDPADLNCQGVPWRHTPYVGAARGTCSTSHTHFGQYGADASRAPWRIAMDYVLYRDESNSITMYDREGNVDESVAFGSHAYLNRIVGQYKWKSQCDGGKVGDCLTPNSNPPYSPWQLAYAFDPGNKPPDVTCENVPGVADTWWAGYMAYPTFTAFVAPYSALTPEESICWMDTFVSICNFQNGVPTGTICGQGYFDLSQEVVSTMVMSNKMVKLGDVLPLVDANGPIAMDAIRDAERQAPGRPSARLHFLGSLPVWAFAAVTLLAVLGTVVRACPCHRASSVYKRLAPQFTPLPSTDALVSGPDALTLRRELAIGTGK